MLGTPLVTGSSASSSAPIRSNTCGSFKKCAISAIALLAILYGILALNYPKISIAEWADVILIVGGGLVLIFNGIPYRVHRPKRRGFHLVFGQFQASANEKNLRSKAAKAKEVNPSVSIAPHPPNLMPQFRFMLHNTSEDWIQDLVELPMDAAEEIEKSLGDKQMVMFKLKGLDKIVLCGSGKQWIGRKTFVLKGEKYVDSTNSNVSLQIYIQESQGKGLKLHKLEKAN